MGKRSVDKNVVPLMPVAVLGTLVKDKPNFMTVAWLTRVNFQPPMIAVSINKNHYSPQGIDECESFSLNFPNASQHEIVDFCGLVSGKRESKENLFKVFYGQDLSVPMIDEFPVNLECLVKQKIELPTNYLYLAEIVNSYANEELVAGNQLNFPVVNPLILSMPDNSYWNLGKKAGSAWKDGLNLKK